MPVLAEYESRDLELTRRHAEALQTTGVVEVSPAPGARWRVTATSYVGTLVVGDLKLLIRPKIQPENLFLLLEPGLPPSAWRQEAFDYDETSDLLPSVVAFFARTLETTLGRGVLRSYEVRQEPLVAPRGRLDVAGQFRRAGVLTPVASTYDDFTEDIVENQVLRSAIRRALRVPDAVAADRRRLMRQLAALEAVTDVPVRPETVDRIHITRLNRHYEPALRLARLVLANLTLADAVGGTTASSFVVDMNDLFQRFVTERLRSALRGRLEVVAEPTEHLGIGGSVPMRPDLAFRRSDRSAAYVADVKYKLASGAHAANSDHYQLLAYATAMDLPEGLLIYCRREGDVGERTVMVKNAGKRLVVRSIDLSGPPESVEEEIVGLAGQINRAALAQALTD